MLWDLLTTNPLSWARNVSIRDFLKIYNFKGEALCWPPGFYDLQNNEYLHTRLKEQAWIVWGLWGEEKLSEKSFLNTPVWSTSGQAPWLSALWQTAILGTQDPNSQWQVRLRLINQRKLQKSCRSYFPCLGEPQTPYLVSVKRKGSLEARIRKRLVLQVFSCLCQIKYPPGRTSGNAPREWQLILAEWVKEHRQR